MIFRAAEKEHRDPRAPDQGTEKTLQAYVNKLHEDATYWFDMWWHATRHASKWQERAHAKKVLQEYFSVHVGRHKKPRDLNSPSMRRAVAEFIAAARSLFTRNETGTG